MLIGYAFKRLLLGLPVLLGISIIVFVAIRLAPGDPALALAGGAADGAALDAIRREYLLDRSYPEQYVAYMSLVLQGNLGRSVQSKVLVAEELAMRYPKTMILALAATAMATLVGLTLGVIAAWFHGRWIDYVVMLLAMAWLSVPNYILSLLLIYLFAVTLGWLPVVGSSSPQHFIMPIFTIAMSASGSLARQTRSAVLEVLGEDYIRTARAKGVRDRVVLVRHALRNALIPIITVIGALFGALMAGTVIAESVFSIDGIGKLMVDRVNSRDYPTVQGAVLLIACSYVIVNILVDLSYVLLDKRVKL